MRYKNQNIAVLGGGLSGSAAALLLRSEGAQVTVLDSAEEKNLLKSTIDNLRAQDVRVQLHPVRRREGGLGPLRGPTEVADVLALRVEQIPDPRVAE